MKEFEKIVKERIRAMNQTELMPFQFKKYPIIIFDSIYLYILLIID